MLRSRWQPSAVCAAALWALALPGRAAEAAGPAAPATPAAADAVPQAVVVQAPRQPQPAGKLSVTAEEMSHVPGSLGDPLKSLQSLPGVAAVSDASSAPAIRGSRPDDNRFVIDGLPAGDVFHVGGLTSVLHPELVSRFDLYSAAFGPEFGDATGGVIDVKLRRPRTDRLRGTLSVGLLGADVLVEGPVSEGQSFYFAGKRSWLDLLKKQASDGKDPDSSGAIVQMPRYGDYLGKYFWRLDGRHELSAHLSGATDRLDLEVPKDSILGQQQPVLAGAGRLRTNDHTEALSLDSQFGAGVAQRLSVGQHTARADRQMGSALSLNLVQRDRFVLEQLTLKPHADHELTLGAELHELRANYNVSVRNARCTEFAPDCDYGSADDVSAQGQVDLRMVNLYAKDRWQFSPSWAATVGVHRSHDSYLHRTNTEPRLGLAWQWSADTLLSAGWGRYDQLPQSDQMVRDLGNPQLDHLHATHAVLGVSQKLSPRWAWQAEVYRKTLSDLVVADATRNYVNGGSGTAHGVELLLKLLPHSGEPLSGWLSLSWARSQRHNDVSGESFRFAYDQPLIINAVASYKLGAGWDLSAKWTYHTGAPDTAVVGTGSYPDGRVRPLYGPLNGERLPAYHRLDLRVEKQFGPRVQFYGELINAYNHQNVDGYGYSADYKRRYPQHQLGMLPSVGVKLAF